MKSKGLRSFYFLYEMRDERKYSHRGMNAKKIVTNEVNDEKLWEPWRNQYRKRESEGVAKPNTERCLSFHSYHRKGAACTFERYKAQATSTVALKWKWISHISSHSPSPSIFGRIIYDQYVVWSWWTYCVPYAMLPVKWPRINDMPYREYVICSIDFVNTERLQPQSYYDNGARWPWAHVIQI